MVLVVECWVFAVAFRVRCMGLSQRVEALSRTSGCKIEVGFRDWGGIVGAWLIRTGVGGLGMLSLLCKIPLKG